MRSARWVAPYLRAPFGVRLRTRAALAARTGAIAVVLMVLGLPLLVSAQEEVDAADGSDYRQLIEKALREHDLGHYEESRAYFERAHNLRPSARTLRGLGLASYELRHYVDAIGYMRQALASQNRPLTAEMRSQLERLLREASYFVTAIDVDLVPDGARLRVDSQPAQLNEAGKLLLDPGPHELVVSAEGYNTIARNVEAKGGEELSLRFVLTPTSEPASEALASVVDNTTPREAFAASDQAPHEKANVAPWILIGGGAAVGVAGGILLALGLSDLSSVEDAPVNSSWSSVSDANDRAPLLSGLGIGLIAAGLTSVAAGAVWRLQVSEDQPGTGLSLAIRPTGLQVRGGF